MWGRGKDAKKKVLEIHMSSHNLEDAGELAHIKVENEHQSLDPDDKGNYIFKTPYKERL